jgi:hypothetical protein
MKRFELSSIMREIGTRIATLARGSSRRLVGAPGILTRYLPSVFSRLFSESSFGVLALSVFTGFFVILPAVFIVLLVVVIVVNPISNQAITENYNIAAAAIIKLVNDVKDLQITPSLLGLDDNGYELFFINL